MPLENSLNVPPYYDDFDANNHYHRLLFRPSRAVQARELTQTQSVLQDQIEKFGKHVFMDGSIIEGCTISLDDRYNYVKIGDTYANGTAFTMSNFVDQYVLNSNGLKALIINTDEGFESNYSVGVANTNFNTLYVKYTNSGVYSNGTYQKTFDASENLQILTVANTAVGNVTVANTGAVPVGRGYAVTITEGTLFQKGFFIGVDSQTCVLTRYTSRPNNVSLGFYTTETIITSDSDESLLDNAQGSSNYAAPGADRLQLTANLVVKTTSDVSNTDVFFAIASFVDGNPSVVRTDPQYNTLGKELARGRYESSGNYVVNPFVPTVTTKYNSNNTANTAYNLLSIDSGLGYVNGFRVETIGKLYADIRKGTDYKQTNTQIVSTTFGNYAIVNELSGEFDLNSVVQVELHSAAKTAVTSKTLAATTYAAGTKIGTAYVKGVAYHNGTPGTATGQYRIYLFNVVMSAGFNYSQTRSIQYYSTTLKGVADIVTERDVSSNTYVATLSESVSNLMVYKFGQKAVKTLNSSIQYTYRDRQTGSFAANGALSITLAAVVGTGSEAYPYSGQISDTQDQDFIVSATANVSTTAKTGTTAVTSGSNVVTGTSTVFLTDYAVGDFLTINTEIHRITSIANNTSVTVGNNFAATATAQTHVKTFLNGYNIPFVGRTDRTITVAGTVVTLRMTETLASTLQAIVYYNTVRSSTAAISKAIQKRRFVKIDCSNNAGGITGPWNLGLPDAIKINAVYVGTAGAYSNSGTSVANSFMLDNGQRDAHYDLSKLSVKSSALRLSNTSTILVDLDHFTYSRSQGVGFFTVDSYPIDDANTANTNAITTQEIPIYTSSDNRTYDLRNSVDFRPFATNTAVSNTVVGNATINPSATLTFDVHASGSFLPAPDSTFQTNLQYYIGRKDRILITPQSSVQVNEGIPSENPRAAPDLPSAMTIALINVPPYPSLSTENAKTYNRYDYASIVQLLQNRRYTMRDIGVISDRVDRLEYYTSLSLLEKTAKDLLVRSDITGGDRFKNGFLVDSFNDHSIAATADASYSIAIDADKGEIRPRYGYTKFAVGEDTINQSASDAAKIALKGDRILLSYTDFEYVSQPRASKIRNCVDANILSYIGSIQLTPSANFVENINQAPAVITNIDLASNWIDMQNAWGTSYGDWRTTSINRDSQYANTSSTAGYVTTTSTSTTTTSNTNQSSSGSQLGVSTFDRTYNFGEFVQNVRVLPYVQSATIRFRAVGMKPSTRVYAFFDEVPVSAFVQSANLNTSNTSSHVSSTNIGSMLDITNISAANTALVTDASGELYGQFTIPANTFRPGRLVLKLCDTSDLTIGVDTISTIATGTFYTDSLDVTRASIQLQTREATVALQNITQTRTLTTVDVKTDTTVVDNTPYVPAPSNDYYYDYGFNSAGDCGSAGNGCL